MDLPPTQANEKPLASFSTFVIPSGGDAFSASPESRDLHFPRLGACFSTGRSRRAGVQVVYFYYSARTLVREESAFLIFSAASLTRRHNHPEDTSTQETAPG